MDDIQRLESGIADCEARIRAADAALEALRQRRVPPDTTIRRQIAAHLARRLAATNQKAAFMDRLSKLRGESNGRLHDSAGSASC
jgi:hypothetical protein